jgi:hypothetical protein
MNIVPRDADPQQFCKIQGGAPSATTPELLHWSSNATVGCITAPICLSVDYWEADSVHA